jgi:hypothetical protein
MRILLAGLLAGCAPFVQISQVGPDTYAAETGEAFVGREAAGRYCGAQGRHVLVTNSRQGFWGATTVFRCLSEHDPEYRRPTYQQPEGGVLQGKP